jgi:hypothetical protein
MDPYSGVVAWNSFEGGTDGTTVSTGNSGGASGTAFSGVQITGTSTVKYESTGALHDTMSCEIVANAGYGLVRWDNAVLGSLTTTCCAMYVKFSALPSAYSPISEGKQTDGGSLAWRINVSSLGNVRLVNASAATVASTTSAPISTGTLYRIEWQITHGTGAYNVQVFSGDSTTALATLSGTSAGAFGTATQQIYFGRTQTPDYTVMIDTLGVDTGALGPRATANVIPVASAGSDKTNGQVSVPIAVTGTSYDTDGTVTAHEWTCTSRPAAASAPTLSGDTTATVTFTPSHQGVYVLSYRVQDDDGAWSSADTVNVYVPATTIQVNGVTSNAGSWTNQGGAANEAAAVTDASDTTYLESTIGTTDPSKIRLRLDPLLAPSAFSMDVKHLLSASGSGNAYVRLFEGATQRKQWTLSPTTSAATATVTLSGGEIATVTSWLALDVELEWGS